MTVCPSINQTSNEDPISEGEIITAQVMFILTLVWLVVHSTIFLYFKRRYSRTQVRVAVFTIDYFLADICFIMGWFLPLFVPVPCWFIFVSDVFMIGFFNVTNFTRNSSFMLMTGLGFATLENGRIPLDKIAESEETYRKLTCFQRALQEFKWIRYGLGFVFRPGAIHGTKDQSTHLLLLQSLKFITKLKGSILFSLTILAPYVLVAIITCLTLPLFRENCYGCRVDDRFAVYTICGLGGVLLSFALFFNIRCSKLPDAWGVFQEETISANIIGLVYIAFILMAFVPAIPNRFYLNILSGISLMAAFTSATTLQIVIAMNRSQAKVRNVGLTRTKGGEKKVQSVGGGGGSEVQSSTGTMQDATNIASDIKQYCPKLYDVLSKQDLIRSFEKHLIHEYADENLAFLQQSWEWKRSYSDIARTASTSRARKIISSYIAIGGLQQLNLPGKIAESIVEQGHENIGESIFDQARMEIGRLMESGPVLRFCSASEYRNYLLNGEIVVNAMGGS